MHLEVRRKEGLTKYYLAHSYREKGKVRKLRLYLGANLTKGELKVRRHHAEEELKKRVRTIRIIRDPLVTVLSPKELREIKNLEARGKPKLFHLSEKDWLRFAEAFAYDTNAIEGSTVTSSEVVEILEKNKLPDRPKEDISETYGVEKAIRFIRKTKEHISIELILQLHRLVFQGSKSFAGQLRPRGVEVVVATPTGRILHRGAPSAKVRDLLAELVRWYNKNKSSLSPLVLAAVVHNQFENIHPFEDGNGRVGRLLLNNILLKHNLPPVNIELKHRKDYYTALRAYQNQHNLRPTLELLLKEYRALKKLLKKR